MTSGLYEYSGGREVVFVVGLGMVGIAFIEKLLNLDLEQKKYFVLTCGEENYFAYNRVGLTEYFEHRNVENLYLNPPSWYAEQQPESFRYFLGETVTSISPSEHLVHTSQGHSFKYDTCVLATGSSASLPSYVTSEVADKTQGVFVYRNIADLEAIISYADKGTVKRAVVVGGGLLGLEAAKAVYDMPGIPQVTIVHRNSHLLSRQLGPEAGEVVLRKIQAMGVEVLVNHSPVEQITRPSSTSDQPVFSALRFSDGTTLEADLVIYAIGIKPRDEIAKQAGIECYSYGGVVVANDLQTSAVDVFAIGECAGWNGNTYGLIGPGIEMADILSFNLTQTESHAPRIMNAPDLSTKLKLMGIDVASFGDYFADTKSIDAQLQAVSKVDKAQPKIEISIAESKAPSKTTRSKNKADGPIQCLVYNDPFSATYKKYIFTADGKYLLGGQMIGDTTDYVKLLAIVKKKKALEILPSELITGAKKQGEVDGDDLEDDMQVCSCHNVDKGRIVKCVRDDGCVSLADIKAKTKAGTGCGGCMPLVTSIFNSAMKKAGHKLDTSLCPHFSLSRADLFSIVRVKNLRDFASIMREVGKKPESLGCEVCKPAIGSILSSLYNEPIMTPAHHQNQDTNDRFLANIQRDGTFSVIPRIAAGEITPDGLIAIGQVAKKYKLYTKITGGQRIDMFGARKDDLPDIWEELNNAGFESGHAYGKALRTVKSCVGTTWCRFGVGDSVGLAVQLENRYRGIRSPHKLKGGVSGCVRECAEAQGKDFGVIATDKGWNVFVGGNGGANPASIFGRVTFLYNRSFQRHAALFARDVPPTQVVRVIDRFLAYYIMTADKLQRTARWIENMDGGIEKLRRVILQDELGICKDLDALMDNLVDTYHDEWALVVKDPEKRRQFKQFANTSERRVNTEKVTERGQQHPADWAKSYSAIRLHTDLLSTPKSDWIWTDLLSKSDMMPSQDGTTSVAVKYGDTQIALFHVPNKGYFATQQMCPHRRAFVLDHGIIGESADGSPYVSCPLHKRNYTLSSGNCLNDDDYQIMSFEARENPDDPSRLQILLPPMQELDAILGTEKWLIKQAESEALGLNSATQVQIVGNQGVNGCVGGALEW
ncbi:NAD(P)H nitrite reductase [Mycena indigotica]|uniref:Nitrite reductase [NAD(P)H] n=1 Tax=Mycena indigotica TaxID=2126181 RepID=A0A8H6RZN0_9AGAR|nr:NAD(P)H nitrite reductase [Mycena indigotica]KAF7289888.1 NAD(P)H nitrite reductase [Mycena indigotica]